MTASVNLRDASAVIELFERAAESARACRWRAHDIVRLPAHGRLVVGGDIHDARPHIDALERLARLDRSSDNHLVMQEIIHGERLVNGLDLSYRTLARAAELVVQHPHQVHVIPGNHELAQYTGRGVSKGAGNSVELFRDGLEYVFGEDAPGVEEAIREYVRAMPVAVLSSADVTLGKDVVIGANSIVGGGGGVMCAHSLPGPEAMAKFDATLLERPLTDADYQPPWGAVHLLTWGRRHKEPDVAALAQRWGVKLFLLGHEEADAGAEARGPLRVVINSDHERAAAVVVDLANIPGAEEAAQSAVYLQSLLH